MEFGIEIECVKEIGLSRGGYDLKRFHIQERSGPDNVMEGRFQRRGDSPLRLKHLIFTP